MATTNYSKYAKWLGGGLGFALGGPMGALLGFVLGSAFDNTESVAAFQNNPNPTQTYGRQVTNADFTASLMVLCAAVMKADGKVTVGELDYVKEFFKRQFGKEHTQEQMHLLKDLMAKEIPVRDVCQQIRQYTDHPSRVQMIHLLFGVATADGHVHSTELEMIRNIASWLGVSQPDFESIKAMFVKDTESSYKILETTAEATDDELKKAYRKMALKYHPDKVAHLGDQYQKDANEKFKSVQSAWEYVKKERGIV
ncbi:MAG: TerB family tellurite resistance protein [Bacteroidota bacterium]|nr:TerB family tellurite resistance protein [Bacteroidota bacterium]